MNKAEQDYWDQWCHMNQIMHERKWKEQRRQLAAIIDKHIKKEWANGFRDYQI